MPRSKPKPISEIFLDRIRDQGWSSVSDCFDYIISKYDVSQLFHGGDPVRRQWDEDEDELQLREHLLRAVAYYLSCQFVDRSVGEAPVIRPESVSTDQDRVLRQWGGPGMNGWESGEYAVIDGIRWVLTPEWRKAGIRRIQTTGNNQL